MVEKISPTATLEPGTARSFCHGVLSILVLMLRHFLFHSQPTVINCMLDNTNTGGSATALSVHSCR